MHDPADQTLAELRRSLAAALPDEAAFEGWGDAALVAAAARLDVPVERARLVYTGGAIDMIDSWFAWIDEAMAERLPPGQLATLPIRARIAALVETRLTLLEPHREALRRALAVIAQPQNAARGAALAWRAADVMWRLAGDTATDLSHYSKRLTLAGVYGSTLLAFLDDESEGHADSSAFLARRIEDVMRFERLKRTLRRDPERRFDVARFLGRLRYPGI